MLARQSRHKDSCKLSRFRYDVNKMKTFEQGLQLYMDTGVSVTRALVSKPENTFSSRRFAMTQLLLYHDLVSYKTRC